MRNYRLTVEVGPLNEGGFLAVCPDLQGCHAEGETIAEAIENVEDVARVIIELCLEKDLPLPLELAIPNHAAKEISAKTLSNILKDLGMTEHDLES